jgi:nucleotide-binding universal stress UspA family protein
VPTQRSTPVRRIAVATDRSKSADFAVAWAADMAERYEAELLVLQVIVFENPVATQAGAAEATRAAYATDELRQFAREMAGDRGLARVVVAENASDAIVSAADEEGADVLVVGNVGMSGRKEFLLGNVPNRVSHNARCTVVIVNSAEAVATEEKRSLGSLFKRDK